MNVLRFELERSLRPLSFFVCGRHIRERAPSAKALLIIMSVFLPSPTHAHSMRWQVALLFAWRELFRANAREVQRLLAISQSPLFSLVDEALSGSAPPSIRAYRWHGS